MQLFTVILTYNASDDGTICPTICYMGRDTALFYSRVPAEELKKELETHNPGCIYEVKELV